MKNIVVDYANSNISISSAFAKKAFTPGTDEYRQLMSVRQDFPEFSLVTRKFKTNTKQERYRGLSYQFMREYITTHEKDAKPILEELDEMIGISKAHSLGKRYPTIKAWFLERYPAIAEFGMTADELTKWRESQKVTELTNSDEAKEEKPAA